MRRTFTKQFHLFHREPLQAKLFSKVEFSMRSVCRNYPILIGASLFLFILLFAASSRAQSPVSLTIDTTAPNISIPPDFSGLSIETGSLRYGNAGVAGNWMDDSTQWPQALHAQMITLFDNLGIRNIRVGGGSVDANNVIPTNSDIDAFFRFVKATNLSVIYSLRLLNGSISQDTDIAKYVWSNYHQHIKNFAIGNEPDFHSYHSYPGHIVDSTIYETDPGVAGSAFPSYLARWETFAAAVKTAIPDVKLGGPDSGSNYPIPGGANTYFDGLPWTVQFADSTLSLGDVTGIYFHDYVGQGAGGTPQSMADAMLSATWDTTYYQELYEATCVPVLHDGLSYRLTESNSFSGGLTGGSTSFATALYSLDYLHWWAEHDASGVNFHNKQWVLNDTIYMGSNGNYHINPMGYGIAAFNIGGHGKVDSVTVTNPDNVDLTAYAVQDSSGKLFVTIINKEHPSTRPFAPAPQNAIVSISANGFPDTASVMYLSAPERNVLAQGGMTLGFEPIRNDLPFVGKWSPIDSVESGHYVVRMPMTTAAIVRIGGPFVSIKPPVGMSPDGESAVPRMATLSWASSTGATGYHVEISADSAFSSVVFDTTTTAAQDTSVQLSTPLNATTKYYWRALVMDTLFTSSYSAAGSFTTGAGLLSVRQPIGVPEKFALAQNYPNPFNPSTEIDFSLDRSGNMSLEMYNVLGQRVDVVADGFKPAGEYSYSVNMDQFASGVYFYTLRQGAKEITRKMLLLK